MERLEIVQSGRLDEAHSGASFRTEAAVEGIRTRTSSHSDTRIGAAWRGLGMMGDQVE